MEQVLDSGAIAQNTVPRYAGFWIRVVSYIIDSIVLGIISNILMVVLIGANSFNPEALENVGAAALTGVYGLSLVINWLYFALLESSDRQATLGKMVIGAKVVDERGERISFMNATGRFFAKILSGLILLIGYIMVAFDSRKQGLHDKLANTFVVYK